MGSVETFLNGVFVVTIESVLIPSLTLVIGALGATGAQQYLLAKAQARNTQRIDSLVEDRRELREELERRFDAIAARDRELFALIRTNVDQTNLLIVRLDRANNA